MKPLTHKRVLAFTVRPLSFGFVAFEGPDELLDWGIRNFRHGVNAVKVPMKVKLALLLDQYGPNVIVIKQPMTATQNRIVLTIATLAKTRRIPVQIISGTSVRRAFPDNNQNKYEIATVIAARYPGLSPRLGAKRRLWEAEHYAMKIFDAAALGVAYFAHHATSNNSRDRTIWPVPR